MPTSFDSYTVKQPNGSNWCVLACMITIIKANSSKVKTEFKEIVDSIKKDETLSTEHALVKEIFKGYTYGVCSKSVDYKLGSIKTGIGKIISTCNTKISYPNKLFELAEDKKLVHFNYIKALMSSNYVMLIFKKGSKNHACLSHSVDGDTIKFYNPTGKFEDMDKSLKCGKKQLSTYCTVTI